MLILQSILQPSSILFLAFRHNVTHLCNILVQKSTKFALQSCVNVENHGRARRRPQYCQTTPSVHPPDPSGFPNLLSGGPEPRRWLVRVKFRRCLHGRLDAVCREEHDIVGHACKGTSSHKLHCCQVRLGSFSLATNGDLVSSHEPPSGPFIRPKPRSRATCLS